jgi:hypothetical protein
MKQTELREEARTKSQVKRLLDLANKLEWKSQDLASPLPPGTCQNVRNGAVALAAMYGVGGERGEERHVNYVVSTSRGRVFGSNVEDGIAVCLHRKPMGSDETLRASG